MVVAGFVAGLVLAAGAGRRFGGPKAVAVFAGKPLVEHAVGVLRDGGCDPVVAVLGAAVVPVPGATVVDNPDWPTGMGSSLRAGLAALGEWSPAAALVIPVDTPFITPSAVQRIGALATPSALVVATYRGDRSHPVLLGRDHWPAIVELAVGDVGARPYLAAHSHLVREVECADIADGTDYDLPFTDA